MTETNTAQHTSKRLIVCLDGTWNTPDQSGNPTNVVKLMRAIRHADEKGTPQIAFYDKGVGTGGPIDRIRGGAFGRGLDDNVMDGYRFLAHNYQADDEIYIFGFSRGAFTARSLAGFIGACGLLEKSAMEKLPRAWNFYRMPPEKREETERVEICEKSRCDVRIKCVGVWDTVGALGVPAESFNWWNRRKYRFHNTDIGNHIDYAFHAIAIDEKRGPFAPALWENPQPPRVIAVEQVWFPGVHSNVGGGYNDCRLSDISLQWMMKRISHFTDLALDAGCIADENNMASWAAGTLYESRSAIYSVSKAIPFLRLIDQSEVDRGWIRKLLPRTNRPLKGQGFLNERVHISAIDRFGKPGKTEDGTPTYRPENLAAAIAKNVGVVDWSGEPLTRDPGGTGQAATTTSAAGDADDSARKAPASEEKGEA